MVGAVSVDDHPVRLLANDDLHRSRLTVFFRLLLVIPHVIVLGLWAVLAAVLLLVAWVAGVLLGRIPDGLHSFLASYLRYSVRVRAYCGILDNPFPPFGSGGTYPVDVEIAPAQNQGRLSIFFRLLLAIPALLLTYIFRMVNTFIAFLSWFYALFTGRASEGMKNLSVWLLRYEVQTYGYLFLLTGKYPTLSDAPRVPAASSLT